MEACSFRSLNQFEFAYRSRNCVDGRKCGKARVKELDGKSASMTICRLSRRLVLEFMGFNAMVVYVRPALAAPKPELEDPKVIRTLKMPSGVNIQDIIEGEGLEAHEGDLVEVNYVCRRSNGYFVHSTVDQFSGESTPVILPLDENQIIQGLKEVLIGMRVGGKRRALIPPSAGYINLNLKPIPDEFGHRRRIISHANEPLIFEVQLLKDPSRIKIRKVSFNRIHGTSKTKNAISIVCSKGTPYEGVKLGNIDLEYTSSDGHATSATST